MSIFDPPFNPSAAILDEATKYGDINPAIEIDKRRVKRDSDLLSLLAGGDEDYVSRVRNQEIVTAGTGTKKAERELAKIRAQLRAREEIVGDEPRLVSDQKPSGFPASRYGTEKAVNTTLRENDFNDAYLAGRKLGLSDRDAKMLAEMKIGQRATVEVEGRPGVRRAIDETEMSDMRRALTKEAAESLDPLVGPYLPTPVEKKITQQVESTPPPIYSKDRRRMAGRLAELLIPLITGASGSYLLIDALDGPDKARVDAELLAQLTR